MELGKVEAHGEAGVCVQDDVLGGDAGGLVEASRQDRRSVKAVYLAALVDAEVRRGLKHHLVGVGFHGHGEGVVLALVWCGRVVTEKLQKISRI